MKSLRLVIILICALTTSIGIGQDISKTIKAYNKAGYVDSSYMLLEHEIALVLDSEKWEAVAHLLNLKTELTQRDKLPSEQLKIAGDNAKFIKDKLGEDHEHYLQCIILRSRAQTVNGLLTDAMMGYDFVIEKDKILKSKAQLGLMAAANKAFLLLYSNKVNEGMAIAREALDNYQEGIDTFFFIQVYQVMSLGHDFRHELEEALEYNQMALDINIKRFGNTHPNVGLTLDQIGGTYKELGLYDKALYYQNKSKSIQYKYFTETGNNSFLANVLGNTSLTYSGIGEYKLAYENIDQATRLQESIFDELNINLLWYYEAGIEILLKSERYIEAQNLMNKALRIVTLNPEASEYDKNFIKSYQADLYYRNTNLDLALKVALEVYEYLESEEEKTSKDFIHIYGLISDIYFEKEQYDQSEKWINKSKNFVLEYYNPMHSEILNFQMKQMFINQKKGNLDANRLIFQKIIRERSKDGQTPSLSNCFPDQYMLRICLYYAADLHTKIKNGDLDQSEYFDFLDEFEKYYEVHLAAIRSQERLQVESRTLKGIYHPGISLLQNSDPEKVILLSEKIKSFQTRLILKNQIIEQDQKEELFSNKVISALESYEDSNRVTSFILVSDLIEEYKQQKDSLFKNDIDAYRKKYGLKDVDLTLIHNQIAENEILIEYYQYDSTLYAIYVSHKGASVRLLDFHAVSGEINNLLSDHSKSKSQNISKLLIDFNLIKDYDKLLIVPDDKLFFINFEELLSPNGEYLINQKTLRYAYSASILDQQRALSSLDRSDYNILGLTPGFSAKMKETYINESKGGIIDSSWLYFIQQPFLLNLANNLNDIDRSKSLTSLEATEQSYKAESSDFKILHLGTHGILNDESPLFSKLIFAKDSIEDGYLHTYEIYGQELNADLAVLSACNSGNGKILEGEGVLSMAHAFTHAGCPSTLMTLWEVDEKSTSQILDLFYKNLNSGHSKSDALRNAKLSFLSSAPAELQDPYYWAGLVLIGNDDPLLTKSPSWLFAIGIGLLLIFGLFNFWRIRSRK